MSNAAHNTIVQLVSFYSEELRRKDEALVRQQAERDDVQKYLTAAVKQLDSVQTRDNLLMAVHRAARELVDETAEHDRTTAQVSKLSFAVRRVERAMAGMDPTGVPASEGEMGASGPGEPVRPDR